MCGDRPRQTIRQRHQPASVGEAIESDSDLGVGSTATRTGQAARGPCPSAPVGCLTHDQTAHQAVQVGAHGLGTVESHYDHPGSSAPTQGAHGRGPPVVGHANRDERGAADLEQGLGQEQHQVRLRSAVVGVQLLHFLLLIHHAWG